LPAASVDRKVIVDVPSEVSVNGPVYVVHGAPPVSEYSVRATPDVSAPVVSDTWTFEVYQLLEPAVPLKLALVLGATRSIFTGWALLVSTFPAVSLDRTVTV
jgi:hypothetical protein